MARCTPITMAWFFASIVLCGCGVFAQTPERPAAQATVARTLDGFEDPASWKVVTADGVTLKVSAEPGRTGTCARLDYDFTRGSGYAIIRKKFDLPLSANYAFSYFVRGSGPRNTMEFKLVDPSGDNVWWVNRRDFEFPADWTRITLPKRKIGFAWGPAGAGTPLATAAFIEIVVTSSNGGRGTVWLDDLSFEELPEVRAYTGTPMVLGTGAARPIGADGAVGWTSAAGEARPRVRIDFGQARELGGFVLQWGERFAVDYDVLGSADGERFAEVARVRGSNGGFDYVQAADLTARVIEIRVGAASSDGGVSLKNIRFMPPEFGDSANEMLNAVAANAPRGWWPRYLRGEASYWTVLGADKDDKEALICEDGAVEVDKLAFSLEPFVYEGGTLRTWADGASSQTLLDGYLPIPSVVRTSGTLQLETTAFAQGTEGASDLIVRYVLRNTGQERRGGKLFVAIRPLQVNPPYQNLNITGGAAAVRHIAIGRESVAVDGRMVVPLGRADGAGAATFDGGEIVEHLALGRVPMSQEADDPRGLCSAGLEYGFDLGPGESRRVAMLVPFHGVPDGARLQDLHRRSLALADASLASTADWWRERLNRVTIRLPKNEQRIVDSVRANLAFILINRDGAGLQPGSRCYERTWIRDGALTSSALLAMGLSDEVREFLDWFAPFQYENGKIPCCVDTRGPDPVPENDSHGEYIAAVRNYFDFTGDKEFLKRHWPHMLRAVGYIEFLRDQRTTPEYLNGPDEKRVVFGLMPESISHEGYSAKPMHSYWDDFWTLKGLRDAAHLAEKMQDAAQASRLNKLAERFAVTLNDSIRLATKMKRVDFVPGCAELGDFDATSTTVALWPCGWEPGDLRPLLDRTFEKYWTFFQSRRDGTLAWKDYTPYEQRVVGSMVLLERRDRALEMLDFFFKDQRPGGWRQWAEVVRKDPREQGYVGDMPHTWVGSDYINSVRVMLAYTRQSDGALVIGAGLPRTWIESAEGVEVKGLRTEFGPLTFAVNGSAGTVHIRMQGLERVPPGGVWFSLPEPGAYSTVEVEGTTSAAPGDGMLRLRVLPAEVTVRGVEAKH